MNLTNLKGSIQGGYAGIYVYGNCEGTNAYVNINGCGLSVTSTAATGNSRARCSGITVYVDKMENVNGSITVRNSRLTATGYDAGMAINNYLGDADATNAACSRITIENSTVTANGTSGTWAGIFASVLGQHPDADSTISIVNSTVYAVSPNTGILTSSQRGESRITLDNSVLGASGKTALSMIEPTCQAQVAELKNGSTYIQMTPEAVMKGEVAITNGKVIKAVEGQITYNAAMPYFVIPQNAVVSEEYTDGNQNQYKFTQQAGGVGGFSYQKEEVWGYDTLVCRIVETRIEYATLTEAVAAANASEGADTILMLKSIEFDSSAALTINGNVTITGEHTISRGAYAGTMFSVPAGSALTLDGGIVFDGSNNWTMDKNKYEYNLMNVVTGTQWSDYATSEAGGTIGTAPMFLVKGTVYANDMTVQNCFTNKGDNNGQYTIFRVEANATLEMNGAVVTHVATGATPG